MYFTSNKRLAQEIAEKVLKRGAIEGKTYGELIQEEVKKIFDEEERKLGEIEPLSYDMNGRIRYNPGLHQNQNQAWDNKDLVYLIEWYSKIGIEEMSLALGRSEGTLAFKIAELRSRGIMDYKAPSKTTRQLPRPNGVQVVDGRQYRKHKLSLEDAKKILELNKEKTYREIAPIYGVSIDTIRRAVKKYKMSII